MRSVMAKRKVYVIGPTQEAADREQWAVESNMRIRATSAPRAVRCASRLYMQMADFRGRPLFEVEDLVVRGG